MLGAVVGYWYVEEVELGIDKVVVWRRSIEVCYLYDGFWPLYRCFAL